MVMFLCFTPVFIDGQTWLDPHHLINLPNKPSHINLENMIGANGGNQIGTNGIPNPGTIKNLRDFYHMEIDFNYSYFPKDGVLNPNQCDCSNVWCNMGDCNTFINNPNGPSSFSSKKSFYCAWNSENYQFSEIYTSFEALFVKDTSFGVCSNDHIFRSYPNKWYSLEEWGGIEHIEEHYRNYLNSFLQTFCPADSSKPCLLNVLEIGNEPWGDPYPGRDGYHKLIDATVKELKSFYGPNKEDWRIEISTAAFEAHNAHPNNYGATEMYIEDMIPDTLRPYLNYVNIHPYALPIDETYLGVGERPESYNGGFLTIKNLLRWRNENMPHAKVNATEFGWNAGTEGDGCYSLGEASQAAYTMRAFILANRYDIHKAFVYAMDDSHEYPLYCSTGLYKDLPSNSPRKTYECIRKLRNSGFSSKKFLKALIEVDNDSLNGQNGIYAYLFGDELGKPTHIVAWMPSKLAYNDQNYPSASNTHSNITLPDEHMTFKNEAPFFYLGWDASMDGSISNNITDIVSIQDNHSSEAQVRLSGLPVVIEIEASNCWYDIDGTLKNCDGKGETAAITNQTETPIKIFPNPTKNTLYMEGDLNNIISIKIYNTSGVLLQQIKNPSQQTINISNFNEGFYLLSIELTNGKIIPHPIIKI